MAWNETLTWIVVVLIAILALLVFWVYRKNRSMAGDYVFRNDPSTVADAFADALGQVGPFDRVVFAIRDSAPGTPAYVAFEALRDGLEGRFHGAR